MQRNRFLSVLPALSLLTLVLLVLAAPSAQAGSGKFQPHTDYATGGGASDIAIGDFNQDGKIDLVTTNCDSNTVSVLMGNGDGTFQTHVDYDTGLCPHSVVVADFNGDGKMDMAVANTNSNNGPVSILLGRGDGTFQPQINTTVSYPDSLAAGDFNNDGKLDLVAVTALGNQPNVYVLLGNGDGTFQAPALYATWIPDFVVVADFNGDGKLDIATMGGNQLGELCVLMGNGDGTFQPYLTYGVGFFPPDGPSVAVADFNHDGKMDVVVADECGTSMYCKQGTGLVWMMLGNGDGTFQTPVSYASGDAAGIAVGDFNGDGKLDVVTSNYADVAKSVTVLLGNGDGTFQPQANYPLGQSANAVAVANLNGDGASDLAVADNSVSILLNSGGTQMTLASSSNPSSFGQTVTFTSTVPATFKTVGTPSGTVTFVDGATKLATVPLASGQAIYTTSTLTVGNHRIRAIYSGDRRFNPNQQQLLQAVTQ